MKNPIKEWRTKANLSQKQLAKKLFITPQAISQYENGKRDPSLDILEKIAKICHQTLTINLQEEFQLKKISHTNAEEQLKVFALSSSFFRVDDESLNRIYSIRGDIYTNVSRNDNARKSVVYSTNDFFIEGKSLKKAKAVVAVIKGPSEKFAYEDFDFLSEYVNGIIHSDAYLICISVVDDTIKEYETTIMAFGYPDDGEIPFKNKTNIYNKILFLHNRLIRENKDKEMIVCSDENFQIKFVQHSICNLISVSSYTKGNEKQFVHFGVNHLKEVDVIGMSSSYSKIESLLEKLDSHHLEELVTGVSTMV